MAYARTASRRQRPRGAKKLTEAGLVVVADGGDLDLALDVQLKTDDMVSGDDDDSDPNTVGTEVAQYTATLAVTKKGTNVASLQITPSYDLRKTTGDGHTVGEMMTKDEADASFRVAALADQPVHGVAGGREGGGEVIWLSAAAERWSRRPTRRSLERATRRPTRSARRARWARRRRSSRSPRRA